MGRLMAPCLALLLSVAWARASQVETPTDEAREIEEALRSDQTQRATTAAPEPGGDISLGGGSGLTAGNSLNPSISLITDLALAYFSEKDNLQRGGHDPREIGFNLQQVELAFQGAVDPYFRFDANLVFSLFGVEVEEAYATTLSLPLNLQVRAGQFLTHMGRSNPTHPHAWLFADQVLVIGKFFGSEGNRGLGAELSVLLPLPWYVEILGSATTAGGGATNRSFFGNDNQDVDHPLDLLYVTRLEQFFPLSKDWSLSWGMSAAFGPNSTGRDNRTEIYATDLYLKWRPISYGSYQIVSLEGEGMLRRRQTPGHVVQDYGAYGILFWRFARRWTVAGRYDFLSGARTDYLDPEETSAEHRASAAFTFFPTEFSRLRLQYSADIPTFRDNIIHAVFLTGEFVIGAHGSHKF